MDPRRKDAVKWFWEPASETEAASQHTTGYVLIGDDQVQICTRCGKDFEQVEFNPCVGNAHNFRIAEESPRDVSYQDVDNRRCMACGHEHDWEARCDGGDERDDDR